MCHINILIGSSSGQDISFFLIFLELDLHAVEIWTLYSKKKYQHPFRKRVYIHAY